MVSSLAARYMERSLQQERAAIKYKARTRRTFKVMFEEFRGSGVAHLPMSRRRPYQTRHRVRKFFPFPLWGMEERKDTERRMVRELLLTGAMVSQDLAV